VLRAVKETIETGKSYEQELRFVRPSGGYRYVFSRAELDRDEEGRPTRLVGTMQDITERKRAEEERQKLERQVLQAQKLESLGVLTGGIAHDFNNLLMAIIGNADLALLELSQDSAAWSNIQAIIETALKASQLTSQMLAYAGKGRFQVEAHDLNSVITKMGHLLKSSVSKKAELSYQLTPGLPSIAADAAQLRQIVLNLVVNADEALGQKSGQITIKTSARELTQKDIDSVMTFEPLSVGQYVVMEVVDSGCGMDDETKAKVFEPFFTTKFAGRGLGLAAVQGIVRGSGGALEVISQPGCGATFRVFFSAFGSTTSRPPVEPEPTKAWRGRGFVLLVDDEAPVRAAAQQMLEKLGFEVLVASDGAEGIELFQARSDDIVCVLLDLQMPKMSGEEVFDEIRALRTSTPVILSSGYGEEEAVQRFAGRGLADFIQKPYRLSALEETLKGVLGA
jgi:signal transduction histidine kinase/CheY-like chemotaxis protein